MTINPRIGISLTLKRKIREKGDIFGTLFTFRQLCKDQESPPPAALLAHANTLDAHGQRVEVALRDATGSDSSYRLQPSQDQQHERDDDADGEDPTGNLERNGGFDLAGPAREGQQIDGGEGVDGVDSQRDQQEHPKKEVGERGETGLGLEIGQVLWGNTQRQRALRQDWRLIDPSPLQYSPISLRERLRLPSHDLRSRAFCFHDPARPGTERGIWVGMKRQARERMRLRRASRSKSVSRGRQSDYSKEQGRLSRFCTRKGRG